MQNKTRSTSKPLTAQRLKKFRQALGFCQYDLAVALGVSCKTIGYYESGGRKPSLGTCYKLMAIAEKHRITGVTLDWLRPEE